MRPTSLLLSVAIFSSAAMAQSITLTSAAACDAQVTVGTGGQTNTLPAGPMTAAGTLQAAVLPFASASLGWQSFAEAAGMGATIDFAVEGNSSIVPVTATLPGVDLVLQISNPTTRPVFVELYQLTSATAGTPTPLLRVDINDDGSEELTEQMQGTTIGAVLQIGPTPISIRVRAAFQAVGTAEASSTLSIRCRPSDGGVHPIAFGCSGTTYQVSPTFSGDLQLMAAPAWQDPSIAVLGFDVAPVLLPSQPWQVCVLMPAPDVLLLLMPWQPLTLAIPPAARPTAIFTQTVGLGSEWLMTSAAYQVGLY